MSRLPTGMFQPGASVLHRMNATAKLVSLLILVAAVCCTESIPGYALLIVFTALLIRLSRIRAAEALSAVIRLKWFFIIIFLMNLCFFSPEEAWVRFWIFCPSYAGAMQGINVAARVALLLVMSCVMNMTTAPVAVTGAIEDLLSPLRILRLPTEQIAMILSVAIQFIPTLFEETDMIRKAQTARGARFDSRRLRDKAAAAAPLVVPIFLAAFRRADELSLAMEARGYRTDARHGRVRGRGFTLTDGAACAVCAALCAIEAIF